MPARHPHRLAHKRGMSIPQWPQRQTLAEACIEKGLPPPTPGRPNSFSVYSVPNPDLPGIPHCLNVFSKKQSQKQYRQASVPAHNYPSTHARIRPASVSPWCLGASTPWPLIRKSIEDPPVAESQSTPFNMDSGVVPSEWNDSRDLPFDWTNMKNKPNVNMENLQHVPACKSTCPPPLCTPPPCDAALVRLYSRWTQANLDVKANTNQ